jgi:hypothetical protein
MRKVVAQQVLPHINRSTIWSEFGGSRTSDAAIAKLGPKNDTLLIAFNCGLCKVFFAELVLFANLFRAVSV